MPWCRFLIGILPAAVVAPLYFQGKIEFGVVNQSSSAFNHILGDVSLIVFQVAHHPAYFGMFMAVYSTDLLVFVTSWVLTVD